MVVRNLFDSSVETSLVLPFLVPPLSLLGHLINLPPRVGPTLRPDPMLSSTPAERAARAARFAAEAKQRDTTFAPPKHRVTAPERVTIKGPAASIATLRLVTASGPSHAKSSDREVTAAPAKRSRSRSAGTKPAPAPATAAPHAKRPGAAVVPIGLIPTAPAPDAPPAAASAADAHLTPGQRRIRALTKRLRDIERLEADAGSGTVLDAAQLLKVGARAKVAEELAALLAEV